MNTAFSIIFEKLLLGELRIVIYKAGGTGELRTLSDDRIAEAVTVNEELRNLGYTLRPADLLLNYLSYYPAQFLIAFSLLYLS